MISVCAWCERFLGVKAPLAESSVTHGICNACFARQTWDEPPILVLDPTREHLMPVLTELLRGMPEIRIVVDRRRAQNRKISAAAPYDRRRADRRRQPPIVVA